MRKLNSKGFTIIELLVVIVIIGILVALALPNLFSAQQRGRDTERKNDLKNISQRLETYYNDEQSYPADQAAAVDVDGLGSDAFAGPKGGETYTYTCTETVTGTDGDTCQAFTLTAVLENKEDGAAVDEDGTYEVKSVNQPTED